MTYDERSGMLGAVQPPPKLLIERQNEADVTCLRLSGVIDEQFDAAGLAATLLTRYLILDLGGVERISSFGIRQWVDFIGLIAARMGGIFYVESSPKVVDQFNMVANFGGPGFIVSFYAPYRCETCDQDRRLLFRTDEETPLWKAGQAPPSICPTCGNAEDFDEDPATYFAFVAQQPNTPLPREVMNFLRVHLSYGQGGQRKLKIEKRIEGRATYVKFSGDLDSDLRAQKLADGLEGEVILDIGGILSIDPVGTAQWRKLMQMLAAKSGGDERVERIHLLSVTAPFLERLGRPEDLTAKGQVISLLIPYNCVRCRATTQRLVDFAQHGDDLRSGRVPPVKCGMCGGPVTCVVSESWFSRLQALPIPSVPPELRATLSRLTTAPPPPASGPPPAAARQTGFPLNPPVTPSGQLPKPGWGAPPPAQQPAGPGPAPTGARVTGGPALSSSMMGGRSDASMIRAAQSATGMSQSIPKPKETGLLAKLQSIPGLLPGLLVVLLSLSAAIVYRILSTPVGGSGSASEWQILDSSPPKAPAWHDPRYVNKEELVFIGHSFQVSDRSDALDRADTAAQVDLIVKLADVISAKHPQWNKAVPALYTRSLQTMTDELKKAQQQVQRATAAEQKQPGSGGLKAAEQELSAARDRMSELQKRVAAVLRTNAPDALLAPPVQYWEKRARGTKSARETGYQASSLIQLKAESFDQLVTLFGKSEALGQTKLSAVPYFPLLSYRYDIEAVHGAILTEIDAQSPLATLGLQIGDIVVWVAGKNISSVADLTKALEQALADAATKESVIKAQRGDQLTTFTLAKKAPAKRTPVQTGRGGKR